ncbi:MarR family transcriptional regulator [Microbacterium sp. X-17]|uniref:MarR family winged helix-turn-helix transcriptional regulator n=1 Tax=Microbacterium sp. X-17 TaxID=3144404 RepID=UPI0031F55E3C
MDTRDDDVDLLIDAWSDILPDVDLTPLDIMSRLRRVARRLESVRRTSFAAADLTSWEFDVLAVLRQHGSDHELSPADLIAFTKASSATMTTRMEKLVARGLIERSPNPRDGRGVLVRLTPEGVAVVDRAMTELAHREAELLQGLDGADAAALVRVLRQLVE